MNRYHFAILSLFHLIITLLSHYVTRQSPHYRHSLDNKSLVIQTHSLTHFHCCSAQNLVRVFQLVIQIFSLRNSQRIINNNSNNSSNINSINLTNSSPKEDTSFNPVQAQPQLSVPARLNHPNPRQRQRTTISSYPMRFLMTYDNNFSLPVS